MHSVTIQGVTLSVKTVASRNAAVISYFLLLILMVVTTFYSDIPEEASKSVVIAVKLLPLLLFLPGIIKNSPRTHIWLCFVVLIYFMQYSMTAYLHEWAIVPVVTTLVTMSVFTSSMMFVHWYKKDQLAAIMLSASEAPQ